MANDQVNHATLIATGRELAAAATPGEWNGATIWSDTTPPIGREGKSDE